MKLTKRALRRIIREELVNESYYSSEISHASKGHNWDESNMSIQIRGKGGSTKWMDISKSQVTAIQKVLEKGR